MKKLLSVILAVMMSVSVFAVAAIPALAVESPTASTAAPKGPVTEVNGAANGSDIRYTEDPADSGIIKFEYTGKGELTDWVGNFDDLGLAEGADYTAVKGSNGVYTVTLISQAAKDAFNNGTLVINAIVKFAPGDTTNTTKKNDSSKSPDTGLATSVIAGSIAVAGAGIAVLSATKKRDAE